MSASGANQQLATRSEALGSGQSVDGKRPSLYSFRREGATTMYAKLEQIRTQVSLSTKTLGFG